VDPFNVNHSVKMSARQWRTLQMFTDEFRLMNEGNAIRYLIDTYAEPLLEKAMAAKTAALAPKTSPKISSPAIAAEPKKHWPPKPAIDKVDPVPVNDDDLMAPPLGNIGGPAITKVLVENEDINRENRVARYEPDQDRYGSIKDD
jgi:hypothetical protein